MELNPSQIKAVTHNKGAMMVLAGPGSGKTTVITRRVAELISRYGVAPEKILVITFTRAAAQEMKERFMRMTGGRINSVNFGTFHAVFFKIIKYAYSYDASNILSEDDRYRFLRDAVAHLNIDVQDEKDFTAQVSSEISKVKNSRIKLENYYSTNCGAEDFRRIYREYDKRLRSENRIDFDDMMLMCAELLEQREDILSFWQERYEYILIDEFQDINLLQYDIIRMLAKPQNNMFIVGDDDQSIYGFRGACPNIMLGFEKDFPGARKVVLESNYRCGDNIIANAERLIAHNRQRFEKQISGASGHKGKVRFSSFTDVREQNDFVVHAILDSIRNGCRFSDNAVLYRINSQPRALVEMLREYNIPYAVADRMPDLYDHWITQNMMAYMELAQGSRDRRLFMSIANRPKRYIPRDIFTKNEMTFRELTEACGDKDYVIRELDRLRYDLDFIRGLDPYAAINYIRKAVGYNAYLREYADYRHIDVDELYEVLNELEEAARDFANLEDWKAYIAECKEESANRQQERRQEDKPRDAVRLMTFHSAKGLEFKNVFIIDANETITPYKKAELAADIEEERRMFYVAMTRAIDNLYISSEQERFGKKLEPSRFLSEM